MNVAMYLRKSREDIEKEKEGRGSTLENHRELLTRYAEENDLTVKGVYEELMSGSTIAARPEIRRLLEDVADGMYDAVLVMDVDRLGRGNMEDQGYILRIMQEAECKVMTPSKTYDLKNDEDEGMYECYAFMARFEYKMARRRMRRGYEKAVEDGRWIWGRPFGYTVKGTGRTRAIEPDPKEAEVVKWIYGQRADGASYQRIADMLNRKKVPTARSGCVWHAQTVKRVLTNDVYIGMVHIYSNKAVYREKGGGRAATIVKTPERSRSYRGRHDAIIGDELWERVRAVDANPPVRKSCWLRNPLSGIAVCASCGLPLYRGVWVTADGTMKEALRHRRTGYCTCATIPVGEAVRRVRRELTAFEARQRQCAADAVEQAHAEKKRSAAQARELKKRCERLLDLVEMGGFDASAASGRIAELQKRIGELNLGKGDARAYEKRCVERADAAKECIEIMKDKHADAATLNRALKKVVAAVEVSRKGAGSRERLKVVFRQ